jgi:large subunit ribosomal protein L25
MVISLEAKAREGKSAKVVRDAGEIPAVVYGAGRETMSVSVSLRDFQKVLKEAGETGTISLTTPQGVITVLVHEVVNDPVRHVPSHVDFLAVDVNKPIHVHVPLEFTGTAPAVKNGLGVLVKVMHEVEIKALPKDVPHAVTVDLGSLETLESHIAVKDLALGAGIEVLADADGVVASLPLSRRKAKSQLAQSTSHRLKLPRKARKRKKAKQPNNKGQIRICYTKRTYESGSFCITVRGTTTPCGSGWQ